MGQGLPAAERPMRPCVERRKKKKKKKTRISESCLGRDADLRGDGRPNAPGSVAENTTTEKGERQDFEHVPRGCPEFRNSQLIKVPAEVV